MGRSVNCTTEIRRNQGMGVHVISRVPRNAPSESISPQYKGTRPCLPSSVCPSFLIVRLNSSRALGCCFQSFVCFCFRSSTKKASILYLGKDKSALFFCVSGISGLHNHHNNGSALFKLKYKHLLYIR